jgi:hypothetical protein
MIRRATATSKTSNAIVPEQKNVRLDRLTPAARNVARDA